jgi:hypothetical protein
VRGEIMRTIREGDRVNVWFSTAPGLTNALVVHKPVDVGDSWYVRTEDGCNHAFLLYERMTKICGGTGEDELNLQP